MDKMTVGEFKAKFGENRAIASLAVIVEDEEKDKKRIIHDATHGVRVNHRIHCRDKIRAPGAEKKQILPRSLSLLKVPTTPVACLIHRSYGATPPATFMHNLPPQVLVPIKRNFSSSFKQQEPFPNVFADTGHKPSCHKCICEALSACLSKLLGRDTFASHLALVTDLLMHTFRCSFPFTLFKTPPLFLHSSEDKDPSGLTVPRGSISEHACVHAHFTWHLHNPRNVLQLFVASDIYMSNLQVQASRTLAWPT